MKAVVYYAANDIQGWRSARLRSNDNNMIAKSKMLCIVRYRPENMDGRGIRAAILEDTRA